MMDRRILYRKGGGAQPDTGSVDGASPTDGCRPVPPSASSWPANPRQANCNTQRCGEPLAVLCETLSGLEEVLLIRLSRSSVSDHAFRLALELVPMLTFAGYRSLTTHAVAMRIGLSALELRRACDELVGVGVLEGRRRGLSGRQILAYRLCEAFAEQPDAVGGPRGGV